MLVGVKTLASVRERGGQERSGVACTDESYMRERAERERET